MHPIAGRCKHCKANLAEARTARAPALAALPPLANAPAPVAVRALPAVSPPPIGATPVALASTEPPIVVDAAPLPATIISVAPTPAREPYNPMAGGAVLPPRPTGNMRAQGERSWLARNWPVVVIILASIAIILAVVLMVLPKQDVADAGKRNGAAGPAPERMDTNPLLPSPSQPSQPSPADPNDPWSNPNAQPVPPDPDDTTQIDPNDPLKDPFSGSPTLGGSAGNVGFALLGNIANRLCEKAKTCSDQTLASMCTGMSMLPVSPLPASCPQAQRCLEVMDQIDVCDGGLSSGIGGPNFGQLMLRTSECLDALSRC